MTSYTQPNHTLPLYECIICKDEYMGEGDSALPIAEGKCCANCYFNKVIDAQLVKAKKLKWILAYKELLPPQNALNNNNMNCIPRDLFPTIMAFADNTSELTKKIIELKKEVKELKDDIDQLRSEINSQYEEIGSLQDEIASADESA